MTFRGSTPQHCDKVNNSGHSLIMLQDRESLDIMNPPNVGAAEDAKAIIDRNDDDAISKQTLSDDAKERLQLSTEVNECPTADGSKEEAYIQQENDSYLNGWRLNTLLLG